MFVKLWMQPRPITIRADETIADADRLLREHRCRRLPVVDGEGMLVGILSREDMQSALPSVLDASFDHAARAYASQAKVEAFMTAAPITTEPSTPLETVAAVMRRHKIGGVPVVEEGRLAGIITESDILRAFAEVLGGNDRGTRVELVIGQRSEAIYQAIDIFRRHDMAIRALTLCNDYSSENRLLTIRFEGEELEEVLDALWRSGCTITRIVPAAEQGAAQRDEE